MRRCSALADGDLGSCAGAFDWFDASAAEESSSKRVLFGEVLRVLMMNVERLWNTDVRGVREGSFGCEMSCGESGMMEISVPKLGIKVSPCCLLLFLCYVRIYERSEFEA